MANQKVQTATLDHGKTTLPVPGINKEEWNANNREKNGERIITLTEKATGKKHVLRIKGHDELDLSKRKCSVTTNIDEDQLIITVKKKVVATKETSGEIDFSLESIEPGMEPPETEENVEEDPPSETSTVTSASEQETEPESETASEKPETDPESEPEEEPPEESSEESSEDKTEESEESESVTEEDPENKSEDSSEEETDPKSEPEPKGEPEPEPKEDPEPEPEDPKDPPAEDKEDDLLKENEAREKAHERVRLMREKQAREAESARMEKEEQEIARLEEAHREELRRQKLQHEEKMREDEREAALKRQRDAEKRRRRLANKARRRERWDAWRDDFEPSPAIWGALAAILLIIGVVWLAIAMTDGDPESAPTDTKPPTNGDSPTPTTPVDGPIDDGTGEPDPDPSPPPPPPDEPDESEEETDEQSEKSEDEADEPVNTPTEIEPGHIEIIVTSDGSWSVPVNTGEEYRTEYSFTGNQSGAEVMIGNGAYGPLNLDWREVNSPFKFRGEEGTKISIKWTPS